MWLKPVNVEVFVDVVDVFDVVDVVDVVDIVDVVDDVDVVDIVDVGFTDDVDNVLLQINDSGTGITTCLACAILIGEISFQI